MNDLQLIREFRADVAPPATERVAAARARLQGEYEGARTRRRARLRLRPVQAAVLTVPVTAAVVAVLIIGALGGSGTQTAAAAIIRHVDAALTAPPNEILHTKVMGAGFVSESWQMTSAPYSSLGYKGPIGGPEYDQANNATTASWYDPSTNTIHEQPSPGQQAFSDPLAQVRQALHDGRARLLGTAQVQGVATYKIQFAGKDGFSSQSLIAYVNHQTYRPILISDPQSNGSIVELRVVTMEYLPANAANLEVLSLTARHPTARVVADRAGKSKTIGK
jgi:hypothetical protein